MKAIVYFLITLFVWMNAMPCSDETKVFSENTNSVNIVQAENHENHDAHQDACGLVCGCNCCGITLEEAPEGVYFEAKQYFPPQKNQTAYRFFYSFNYKNTIWHPPSIV